MKRLKLFPKIFIYIYALSYVDDSFIGKWNVLSPGSYYDGGRCNNC